MANVSDTRLAWLAGIIDGEGSIYITSDKSKRSPNVIHSARIHVTNTNSKIIEEAADILSILGVAYRKSNRTVTGNRKPCQDIVLDTPLPICILLQWVGPYLVGKREHAQYIQEYIWENSKQYHGYSPWSLRIVDKLSQLNKRGR